MQLKLPFEGYYRVINSLVAHAFKNGAEVVTCAADDMDPDPEHDAQEIAEAYLNRFPDGLGILQACGDPQGVDEFGHQAASRICGSPTFGRGWFEKAYGGKGPFWDDYRSFYCDEELKEVAEKLGVLWMASEYTFLHKHWSWGWRPQAEYQKRNSDWHWSADKELFDSRKKMEFPGHAHL